MASKNFHSYLNFDRKSKGGYDVTSVQTTVKSYSLFSRAFRRKSSSKPDSIDADNMDYDRRRLHTDPDSLKKFAQARRKGQDASEKRRKSTSSSAMFLAVPCPFFLPVSSAQHSQ